MSGRGTTWERSELDRLERLQANERNAKNWQQAYAFLTECHLLKDFILWIASKEGFSDDIIAALDSACDKIEYPHQVTTNLTPSAS